MSEAEAQAKTSEKLWLLIEWETTTGPNTYTVINSNDIVSAAQHELYTGKSVFVRRSNCALQATIVTISKDKKFLDTELRQLKRMSDENLNKEEDKNRKQRKRRRTLHPIPKPGELTKSVSTSSLNFSRGSSPDSNCGSSTTTANYTHVPPMTFDQQTQTDKKSGTVLIGFTSDQLEKIVSVQESLLEEHKTIRADSTATRQILNDLTEQLATLTNMCTDIKTKLNEAKSLVCNNNNIINANNNIKTPIILNGAKSSLAMNNIQPDESVIIFETHDETKDDISLENSHIVNPNDCYENNENVTISFNATSRYSFNESSIESQNKDLKTNVQMPKVDWSEVTDEKEKNEFIHIGVNKTPIPIHIMRSIKWTTHTAATRKLLMAVFPRQVLATHSLTGKPSPAFQDRAKPPKMMLDNRKITDIIQTVTKYSRVPESVVRNAITTKCADENKMYRQRLSKSNNSRHEDVIPLKITNDNKENILK